MAFMRKKRVGGREYNQLVENYREDGKHKQRVLAHLGSSASVEAAAESFEQLASVEREVERKTQEDLDGLTARLKEEHAWAREHYKEKRRELAQVLAECAAKAEDYEAKAAKLRHLIAIGKAAPDTEEMRREREAERRERQKRIKESEPLARFLRAFA